MLKHLFYSLSITFLLLSLADYLRPYFVTNFLNINWLFLLLFIVWIMVLTKRQKDNKINHMIIEGVKIKKLKIHQDVIDNNEVVEKPGHLMEVLRDDDNLLERFGQTTFTVAYPGTVKAFHWHKYQDDLWFFSQGKAVVVLYDMRDSSSTKGMTQEIVCDAKEPQLILIPIGVAHGYKVLGSESAHLFYHTTKSYSVKEPDEERISHNDERINFDWNKYN